MKNVIYTTEGLAKEQGQNPMSIIIKGELANKLHKLKKMGQLSKRTIAAISALLGTKTMAKPVNEGISYGTAVPVAVISGLDIPIIIWASKVGIDFLLELFNSYTEQQYSNDNLLLVQK